MNDRTREAIEAYRQTVVKKFELEEANERRLQALSKLEGEEWQRYVEARRQIETAVWDCRRSNLEGKAWSRFWRLRIERADRTTDE
jgi:DNA-binding TFAR19-related protein (PDSD5 family)